MSASTIPAVLLNAIRAVILSKVKPKGLRICTEACWIAPGYHDIYRTGWLQLELIPNCLGKSELFKRQHFPIHLSIVVLSGAGLRPFFLSLKSILFCE